MLLKIIWRRGIKHKLSYPHTPQHNGVAKRKQRHFVEIGLTMMFHADLPLRYWEDSFLTACYLINHLLSIVLSMSIHIILGYTTNI